MPARNTPPGALDHARSVPSALGCRNRRANRGKEARKVGADRGRPPPSARANGRGRHGAEFYA
jgi:hypothetical protein